MRTAFGFVIALIVTLSIPRVVLAADGAAPPPEPTTWKADPLFPGAGHGSIGVATGVPFLAMGEAAYAPTSHFAIGAIVGITPFVFGAGLRPRVGVPIGERTRISLVSPVLWYPTGDGLFGNGAPWFLAQPSLRLERRVGRSFYANANAGLIAAVGFPSHDESGQTIVTYNDRRVVGSGTPWGVWNTFGVGVAASVFDRTTVFADGIVIMRGVRLAGDDWIGGPPFAFTVGVTRTL
ncbi:MAG: hypothetical protein ABI551_01445 [Polyangiaceae bacterium]